MYFYYLFILSLFGYIVSNFFVFFHSKFFSCSAKQDIMEQIMFIWITLFYAWIYISYYLKIILLLKRIIRINKKNYRN